MNSFKSALMKKVEDRKKEMEEIKKIESEQKKISPISNMQGKKALCLRVLGPELYEKVYAYMKKAKSARVDFPIIQKEVQILVGKDKDKMNMVFFIDQIVETESMKAIYV